MFRRRGSHVALTAQSFFVFFGGGKVFASYSAPMWHIHFLQQRTRTRGNAHAA